MSMEYFMDKKITKIGQYPAILLPEHKRSNKQGYVYVHILVAEKILGRTLTDIECVHHVNSDKEDFSENNIWIFKTLNDHTTYHMAIKNRLNFRLTRTANVYTCTIIKENIVCPICKNIKSPNAKLCNSCNLQQRRRQIPSEDVLAKLLLQFSYSDIGRQYNVSPNAVTKWAKQYGLYKKYSHTIPPKEELSNLIKDNSIRKIGKIYGVHSETIINWLKKYDIKQYPYITVKCVETGEIYETKKDAAIKMYPQRPSHSVVNDITKSCLTKEALGDYHWEQVIAYKDIAFAKHDKSNES